MLWRQTKMKGKKDDILDYKKKTKTNQQQQQKIARKIVKSRPKKRLVTYSFYLILDKKLGDPATVGS